MSTIKKQSLLKILALWLLVMTAPGCQQDKSIWSDQQLRILQSLSLDQLAPLPDSPSNRYANNRAAAAFGQQLFFDQRFSANQSLSCASCHRPELAFTDGIERAVGINATGRNTPSVVGAAWQNWFYWDGRKDSLWSQALVPFEAADEMASSRLEVLRIVGRDKNYLDQYQNLFGRFPRQILAADLPDKAGPLGDAKTRDNWYRIPAPTQQLINTSYANIGKAIAAFERTLHFPTTAFDRYVENLLAKGEAAARQHLSENAVAGLKLFIDQPRSQCLRCHNGPLLSNNDFHNIGTGKFEGEQLDFGRLFGLQVVLMDEFNCLGPYSDAEPDECSQLRFVNRDTHALTGAFKTPTLRNIAKTGPYFHDGRYKTLTEAVRHYTEDQANDSELAATPIDLNDQEIAQLVAFLQALSHTK